MQNRSIRSDPFRFVSIIAITAVVMLGGCAKQPVETPETVEEEAPEVASSAALADAGLLASNNDLEGAAAILENLTAREQNNIEALRMLARVYGTMGKRDASADAWKRVAMLDPTDADATYEVGTILARKGDWTGVRSKMLAAEAAGAADSRHFLLIGEADKELGYLTEAETYLKRAIGLERGRYLLGALYYDRGKLAKARGEFEKVIEMNPGNHSAHLHLGWIHYNGGDLKRALHHYRKAADADPDEPLARLSLAALLAEMKKTREAIQHYVKGLSLEGIPKDERKKAYISLSRLLVEEGMLQDARTYIRKGLAEFPSSGGLYYHWGEERLKAGKPLEAREKFKAAAQDPIWREIALRKLHSIE